MAGDEDKTVDPVSIPGWTVHRNQVEWQGHPEPEFLQTHVLRRLAQEYPGTLENLGEDPSRWLRTSRDVSAMPRMDPSGPAFQHWSNLHGLVAELDALLELAPPRSPQPDVAPMLESLREFANELARGADFHGIPPGLLSDLGHHLREMGEVRRHLKERPATDTSAPWSDWWTNVKNQATGCYRTLAPVVAASLWRMHEPDAAAKAVREHSATLGRQVSKAAKVNRQLAKALRKRDGALAEQEKQSTDLLAELQKAVTAEAIKRHELKFAHAEERHRARGYWWLLGVAAAVVGAIWAIFGRGELSTDAATFSPTFVLLLASRIGPIALALSAAFWAARNYAVERHNETINAQRVDALASFEQLLKGAGDRAEERQMIMAAVTKCLYTIQPTTPNARATDPGLLGLAEALAALRSSRN